MLIQEFFQANQEGVRVLRVATLMGRADVFDNHVAHDVDAM